MSQPSPLPHQPFALIPVYHWQGARLPLLDLEEDQRGGSTWLIYTREGEHCLIPLAWFIETPGLADDPRPFFTGLPCQIDPLDPVALTLTLSNLHSDGWRMIGRLDVNFTGRYADPTFEAALQPYLPPHYTLPTP